MPMQLLHSRASSTMPHLGDDEEITHTENATKFFLGSSDEGMGTLHLTTKHVIWLSSTDEARGYSFNYQMISLHAISRDPEAFPEPCLYCQLDVQNEEEEAAEMRFVPAVGDNLQPLFEVFSEMAALNPDEGEESEGESESGMYDENGNWIPEENEAAMEDAEMDNCDGEEEEKKPQLNGA